MLHHKSQIILLVLLSVGMLISCSGKQQKIEFIRLTIEHSKRISDATVVVELTRNGNGAAVHLISRPMEQSLELMYTQRDTTFSLGEQQYSALCKVLANLQHSDFSKASVHGKDGVECCLEYGEVNKPVVYKFWSPDYDTEASGLTEYLNTCPLLLKMVGLDPHYLLST
ncbi:MAG TPA: hypothetical protein VMW01_05425 [Williamwhitmania sp.]|nr:hypothetical protein [Williamwhitmania sp.]